MAVAERASGAIEPAGLPGLWHAADAASAAGQRAANRRTGARLLLLLGAAVAGAASWTPGGRDVPALAAALAFFLALLLELRSALDNPEQRWYRGRAVAESVKTLAWRFAVGGAPFGTGRSDAEALLLDRLRDIIRSMRGLEWTPTDLPDQVTGPMRALRGRSLADRRTTYLRDRIGDQFAWYTRAAKRCTTVADRWSVAVSTVTAAGFAGAILKGAGMLDVDVMGIASAGVASATAWTSCASTAPWRPPTRSPPRNSAWSRSTWTPPAPSRPGRPRSPPPRRQSPGSTPSGWPAATRRCDRGRRARVSRGRAPPGRSRSRGRGQGRRTGSCPARSLRPGRRVRRRPGAPRPRRRCCG